MTVRSSAPAWATLLAMSVVLGCQARRAIETATRPSTVELTRANGSPAALEEPCAMAKVRTPDFTIPRADEPGDGYSLPRFGMSVTRKESAIGRPTMVLLRDERSRRAVELIGDAPHDWLFPSDDPLGLDRPEKLTRSWLMRRTHVGHACGPSVSAYDPRTLERQWVYPIGELWVEHAFERNGRLILDVMRKGPSRAPDRRALVALDISNGAVAWKTAIPNAPSEPRDVLGRSWGDFFIATFRQRDRRHLVAIDVRTGTITWTHASGLDDERLFLEPPRYVFEDRSGSSLRLRSVDVGTGREEWAAPARTNPSRQTANGACCAGLRKLGTRLLLQDLGPPVRLRSIDAGTGREHWALELPGVVDLGHSRLDGRYWVLVDGDQHGRYCPTDGGCSGSLRYDVIDPENGRLVSRFEIPAEDEPGAHAIIDETIVFEVPTRDARFGHRARTEAYALASQKRLWQGKSVQCGDALRAGFFSTSGRLYACECDQVLRAYDARGVLRGEYGVENCDLVTLEAGKIRHRDSVLDEGVWSEPKRELGVFGTITEDDGTFSGWVQVGDAIVRADARGRYSAKVRARGWVLVQPKPPLGIDPEAVDSYMAPPSVTTAFVPQLFTGWVH